MAGHPNRNWDAEDFICRRCRLIGSKSSSPSNHAGLPSFGVNKRGQAPGAQPYYVSPSNHLGSYSTGGYQDSSSDARYPCDHSNLQTTASSTQSYPSQTRSTGVTFAHYQPQQGGFSTSRPTYSVQGVSPQHSRYTITPHPVSPGATPYTSTIHVSFLSTLYEHTS